MTFESSRAVHIIVGGVCGFVVLVFGGDGFGLVGGGRIVGVGAAEFDAEEANGLFFDGSWPDERELREGFHVHEVVSLLFHSRRGMMEEKEEM